jgi:HD-GYP domain-containing protein (c-di-GMP phosphodiesterase class II)
MSDSGQVKQRRNLVRELIRQLSRVATDTGRRSLGVVGPGVSPSSPPAHCLRACLHDDPQQIQACGCPWLRRAAEGQLDASCLKQGCCAQGFQAMGQPVRLSDGPAFLLVLEDAATGPPGSAEATVAPEAALGKVESLSRMVEQVGQLLDENEGLANEVLRSYEQLNLIFEFTQQIASLTEVEAIEQALLTRLGKLLAARTMLVIGPEGGYRCYDVACGELIQWGAADDVIDRLGDEIEALRQTPTVSVHSSPVARVVLGALRRADEQVDVVLATRPSDVAEFNSGDMMMLESILAFGGQIISNSEMHERLRRMSLESTRALVAAIDKKDHYTSGHSERVGFLARLTAARMGVSAGKLQALEMAALLHDVGKIGVPEEILCKCGKLADEEFAVIKQHPVMGYDILKPIGSFRDVLDGVLYHHENADGSGYPKGLAGEDIPLFARIIHVVDVFDALTSDRSYRAAYSFEQACQILREEAGTKLDPAVVSVFLELLVKYRTDHPEEFAAAFAGAKGATDAET